MSQSITAQFLIKVSEQFAIYSSILLLSIGFIGNLLLILVFYYFKFFRNNQCAFFLTIEAIANLLFLNGTLPFRIINYVFPSNLTQTSLYWCKIRKAIIQSFALIPFLLICFTTIDQYLSTNSRIYLRQLSTLKLAYRLTCLAIFLWIIHSIPSLIFTDLRFGNNCAVYNDIYKQYLLFFQILVINGFLPIFISSTFAILAYLNVRRIIRHQVPIVRRKLDRQLTALVLTKVTFSVCTVLPFVIDHIYTLYVYINPTDSVRRAIEQLILTITSSLFYLNSAVSCKILINIYLFFILILF